MPVKPKAASAVSPLMTLQEMLCGVEDKSRTGLQGILLPTNRNGTGRGEPIVCPPSSESAVTLYNKLPVKFKPVKIPVVFHCESLTQCLGGILFWVVLGDLEIQFVSYTACGVMKQLTLHCKHCAYALNVRGTSMHSVCKPQRALARDGVPVSWLQACASKDRLQMEMSPTCFLSCTKLNRRQTTSLN